MVELHCSPDNFSSMIQIINHNAEAPRLKVEKEDAGSLAGHSQCSNFRPGTLRKAFEMQ